MKKIICVIAADLIVLLAIESRPQATNLGTAAVTELALTTPTDEGVFTLYLKNVFRELGNRSSLKITVVELPRKRALVDASKGKYDGLAARIKGMENLGLPNMRIIGGSHFTVQHVLFAKRQDIKNHVTGLQSLIDDATY